MPTTTMPDDSRTMATSSAIVGATTTRGRGRPGLEHGADPAGLAAVDAEHGHDDLDPCGPAGHRPGVGRSLEEVREAPQRRHALGHRGPHLFIAVLESPADSSSASSRIRRCASWSMTTPNPIRRAGRGRRRTGRDGTGQTAHAPFDSVGSRT